MKEETKNALIKLVIGAVIEKTAEYGITYVIEKLDRKKSNKYNIEREKIIENFKITCNNLINNIENRENLTEELIQSKYKLYLETVTLTYEKLQEINLNDNTSMGLRNGFYYQGVLKTLKKGFDDRLYKVLKTKEV